MAQKLEGQIVLDNGLPAGQVKLALYARNVGDKDAKPLGITTTSADGKYSFNYDPLGKAFSLEVRAVGASGDIPLSRPLNDLVGVASATVNLAAPASLKPLPDAEYRRLAQALKPLVGDLKSLATSKENAERQDLTVLNGATGWDARLIARTATAERLGADPDAASLSREALYGLLRAGLPADKLALAHVDPDVAESALKKARDAGIVGLSDAEIGQFRQQFSSFASKVRLAAPIPGSHASYAAMLGTSGLGAVDQDRFAQAFLAHRDGEDLWQKARDKGLKDDQIGRLQLQGKLAFLTANSDKLTTRLQQVVGKDAPTRLVDKDLDRAESWIDEITTAAGIPPARRNALTEPDKKQLDALIPPVFSGGTTEARRDAWAEDMARIIRVSYPTHVVARTIERDATDPFKLGTAREVTAKLLKGAAAQGFKLGQTPPASFLRTYAGARTGLSDGDFKAAQQQVAKLHRVYQVTPDNEAMTVLLGLGISSAYDVTAYSAEEFTRLFKGKYVEIHNKPLKPLVSEMVYHKARQVSSVTYNLFTMAKTLDSAVPVYGMSAPAEARAGARDELIKHFPTMETLFGSSDYCECEHCRSVLSPAAYLVDLLQFLDPDPAVWDNFLARWRETHGGQAYDARYRKPYDALIARRPDLPHIALTCENTHTALPYIDLVNEILEYYVAHDKLEADAARDTGNATTAELLAEPQNIIRQAYDKVGTAQYPLTLPFDLWLDSVRAFCGYFDVPLWRLLEAFRAGDELFVPAHSFDRAAIFYESLGLSPAEVAIFTDPDPLPTWHRLYGFESEAAATTVATDAATKQRVDLNSAKALSHRLGVTYTQLVEIVQTGFVNPKLDQLVVLTKLGVSIHDVRSWRDANNRTLYDNNRDLLDKKPGGLGAEDQKRADALSQKDWQTLREMQSFELRLKAFVGKSDVPRAQLAGALEAIPLDEILVLADPDAGCDFDRTTVQYASARAADPIGFLKINLFVRLWRKLGWTIEETDSALRVFVPEAAPFATATLGKRPLRTALVYLAHLKALDEKLGTGKPGRLKLVTLWSNLATKGKDPLYAHLLLARAVLKSDEVFDDPLGRYLSPQSVAAAAQKRWHEVRHAPVKLTDKINPAAFAGRATIKVSYDDLAEVQYLSFQGVLTDVEKAVLKGLSPAASELLEAVQAKGKAFSLVNGHMPALEGALGLTADDIRRILEDVGESLDTAALTLDRVSLLYRYGILAKGLKLPVCDLIALKALCGLEPFKALHPDPLAKLEEDHPFVHTLRFVDIAAKVRDTSFKIEDLDYLLRHRFDASGKYRPDPKGTVALLRTLSQRIRAIRSEHAVPADPGAMGEDVLRQKLGLILPPDVVDRFLALMNKPAGGAQAQGFFDMHLLKEAPDVQPANGFLDAADFALLFAAPAPGLTAAEEQERLRLQRTKLADTFLPFLQERLIRQFLVQTLTAHTAADPSLVEALLGDTRLLGVGAPAASLLAILAATGERGLSASFFAAADGSGAALHTSIHAEADTGLKDKNGKRIRPDAASATFDGYLEVPAAGAYRFFVVLDKKDASVEMHFDHLPGGTFWHGTADTDGAVLGNKPAEYIELDAGVPYRFTARLTNLGGGEARILVQGETRPKDGLGHLSLYPLTALAEAERGLTLLKKSLALVQGFGLNVRELRYLSTRAARFGDLDLKKLPTLARDDSLAGAQALFRPFMHLAAYSHIRAEIAGGTDDLVRVFEANESGGADKVYPIIAALARRDEATVKTAARALAAAPAFASEEPLQRLWDVLRIVEQFGVPVSSVMGWTHIAGARLSAEQRFAIARDLKSAIKARFEPEAWQRVAQPIFDKLRQRQRDALVAYVMHRGGFARLEQLYDHFLIDPGMEPVVQTSRLRLAIGSVQLFIQKCLLNLEKQVPPPALLNASQWEWMKRYRVWEANRKIFLFPENWLEPEFRDDKTHLFSELEGTLLQGDVTSDLVEDVFLNYLRKLDELARLDIVAMHLEDKADPAQNRLHVIGRTPNDPHKYFYRRYAHQAWTPWEPVTAEIEGDHLAPVVWRDRLYLFWVTFVEKPKRTGQDARTVKHNEDATVPAAETELEAQLHWSEYLEGEWTTRESGSPTPPDDQVLRGTAVDPRRVFIHVSKEPYENGEERGVYIHLGWPYFNAAFYLAGRNSVPRKAAYSPPPRQPYSPKSTSAAQYLGKGPLTVVFTSRITTTDAGSVSTTETPSILELGDAAGYALLPCNNQALSEADSNLAEIVSLTKPVFYQDNKNTFLVEPTLIERTIDEWKEWVRIGPVIDLPDLPRDLPLIPWIPRPRIPIPGPGDPRPEIDYRSLINVKSDLDWLVNPATGLVFDGELIGATGRVGASILPPRNVAAAVAAGASVLNVHPGSDLAAGHAPVFLDEAAVERAGLRPVAGGLNVIGDTGFNTKLAENLNANVRPGLTGGNLRGPGRFGR